MGRWRVRGRKLEGLSLLIQLYGLKHPRRGLRIPNTDPAPFVFCEFCKKHADAWGRAAGASNNKFIEIPRSAGVV
jgi:hypothetical protein